MCICGMQSGFESYWNRQRTEGLIFHVCTLVYTAKTHQPAVCPPVLCVVEIAFIEERKVYVA